MRASSPERVSSGARQHGRRMSPTTTTAWPRTTSSRRTSSDPRLEMMTLNIPLDMMRQGRIRGTLTELAELVAAVDLSATIAAYLATALRSPIGTAARVRRSDRGGARGGRRRVRERPGPPRCGASLERPRRSLARPPRWTRTRRCTRPICARSGSNAIRRRNRRPPRTTQSPAATNAVGDAEPTVDARPARDPDEAMRDYILAHAARGPVPRHRTSARGVPRVRRVDRGTGAQDHQGAAQDRRGAPALHELPVEDRRRHLRRLRGVGRASIRRPSWTSSRR